MTEPSSRDRTFTGDILRDSGAKMFWFHGPEKAGSVMVLHSVSRQHFSALTRLDATRRQAMRNMMAIDRSSGELDNQHDE